jgi:hypothetical protein
MVVRSASGRGTRVDYVWDGLSDLAALEPDGLYTFHLTATLSTMSTAFDAATTLDNTPPSAAIASPANGSVVSNVYQNGATDVPAAGTATDLNFLNWTLEYGAGAAPSVWTALASAVTTQVSGAQMALWPTAALANGSFTLRLRVYDKAGNSTFATALVTVGNFSASEAVQQFNGATGQTQSYTSIVPFPLTETLTIKRSSGELVRTLVNGISRNGATYVDAWNGRDDANVLVSDGGYLYYVTVSDGTHQMTWDQSAQFGTGFWNNDGTTIAAWDPLNNKPMIIPYNFPSPSRIIVAFGPTANIVNNCNPPQFCPVGDRYEESGSHKYYWAGVDPSGVFRSDVRGVVVVGHTYSFAKNAVVVYGTKPVVNSLTVQPPIFSPENADQQIKVDFTSYQSEAVNVWASPDSVDG